MKTIAFVFILLLKYNFVLSQTNCDCSKDTIKGEFLYEFSQSLWACDDMIFRKPIIVKNRKIKYRKGVFLFETAISENYKCRDTLLQNYIAKFHKNEFEDSLHRLLNTLSTSEEVADIGKFKSFYFELEIIYIGKQKIDVPRKYKIHKKKKIPTYLIVQFINIKPR